MPKMISTKLKYDLLDGAHTGAITLIMVPILYIYTQALLELSPMPILRGIMFLITLSERV